MSDSATSWIAARQAPLSFNISQNLLKLMSIESVMPSNHFILYSPHSPFAFNFPSIRVFSSESALCIRWWKYWRFSFSIILSNEYSGLISFRTDWFELHAVQGTPKSLLQHHSSKALILWCWVFFIVQLTFIHDYWKNNSLDNGTPLQYSCLENPMDGGAWWAAVHGVTKSQTQLSDLTFFSFICIISF